MEAQTADGRRGFIFDATISISPYAGFLRAAIDNKLQLLIVSQDDKDIGDKRVIAGHGHSHEPEVPPVAKPVETAPPVLEQPADPVKPETAQQPPLAQAPPQKSEDGENKVTGEEDMAAEIERMMQKDIEMMELRKAQNTVDVDEPLYNNVTEQPPVDEAQQPTVEAPQTTPPPIQMPRLSSLDVLANKLDATMAPPVPEVPITTPEPVAAPEVTTPPPPVPQDPVPVEPITPPPPPTAVVEEQPPADPTPAVPEGFCDGDDCGKVKPLNEGSIMAEAARNHEAPPPPVEPTTTPSPVVEQPPPPPPEDPEPAEFAQPPQFEPITTTTPAPVEELETPSTTPAPAVPEVNPFADRSLPPPPPSDPGFLATSITSLAGGIRSLPGLNGLSDGGIGIAINLTILAMTVVWWLINSALGGSDSVNFERRAAHDLASKVKALQTVLKEREEELRRHQINGGQDQQAVHQLSAELNNLRHLVGQAEEEKKRMSAELKRESEGRQTAEHHYAAEREALEAMRVRVQQLEHVEQAHQQLNNECQEVTRKLNALHNDLIELRHQKERVDGELNLAKTRAEELSFTLEAKEKELKDKENMADELEGRTVGLESMIVDLQARLAEAETRHGEDAQQHQQQQDVKLTKATKAQSASSVSESGGGSNGWSDFDCSDDEKEKKDKEKKDKQKETTPPTQQHQQVQQKMTNISTVSDIQEVARLRGEIHRLELKINSAGLELEREQVQKKVLEERVKSLDEALKQKSLELDKCENERRLALEHQTKLLGMFQSAQTKSSDTENMVADLRIDARKLEDELRKAETERREKEVELKAVEEELRKLRHDHVKLETKHFALNREHRNLMDQKALGASPSELLAGLGPSGLDRLGAGSRGGGGLLSGLGFESSDGMSLPSLLHLLTTIRIVSAPPQMILTFFQMPLHNISAVHQ
ncbi:unnamed protein product, partial [Mesorhabditis spiculigera]